MTLTLFYDGQCPLCVMEMTSLQARDTQQRLNFEDIWQADFSQRYPNIDAAAANRILHAIDDRGQLLLGLDVTAVAWSLVGVNRYRALRWPVIRPIADFVYHRFANNRYGISRLLTGRARLCESGQCDRKSPPLVRD